MSSNPYSGLGDVDPYTSSGELGGFGMEDIYSEYHKYGSIMGDVVGEGGTFELGGMEFGLPTYDVTQENKLREIYKEDYLDFTRTVGDLYGESSKTRSEMSKQISKSGFAGSGQAGSLMDEYQAGITEQMKELREGMKETRLGLSESIAEIREDYSDDLFSTYMMFLDANPEFDELGIDTDTIIGCYDQGLIYNPATENCAEMGELPEEWTDVFEGFGEDDVPVDSDIPVGDDEDYVNYDLEPKPDESWEAFCERVGNSAEGCVDIPDSGLAICDPSNPAYEPNNPLCE